MLQGLYLITFTKGTSGRGTLPHYILEVLVLEGLYLITSLHLLEELVVEGLYLITFTSGASARGTLPHHIY